MAYYNIAITETSCSYGNKFQNYPLLKSISCESVQVYRLSKQIYVPLMRSWQHWYTGNQRLIVKYVAMSANAICSALVGAVLIVLLYGRMAFVSQELPSCTGITWMFASY